VAVLVGDGEDEIDFVHAQPKGRRCRSVRIATCLRSGCLR
jgi:hypothetical protein